MFKKIIKYYADKRLLAYFETQHRIISINTLQNSKSVGILWNPNDERSTESYEQLRKKLQSKGIKINGLAHVNSRREIEMLLTITTNSGFLHKSNVNWYGRPRSSSANNFIQEPFDILIDLTITKNKALQYLLVHSHAKFKVGWHGTEPNFYDLNIDVTEKPQVKFLLEQILHYLENLNEKE